MCELVGLWTVWRTNVATISPARLQFINFGTPFPCSRRPQNDLFLILTSSQNPKACKYHLDSPEQLLSVWRRNAFIFWSGSCSLTRRWCLESMRTHILHTYILTHTAAQVFHIGVYTLAQIRDSVFAAACFLGEPEVIFDLWILGFV